MAHNVVFAPLIPRHRVYVSFICMCGSMTMIGVLIFILRLNHMVIIFLAIFASLLFLTKRSVFASKEH